MIPEVCRQGSILGADFDPEHIPEMVETEEWSLSGNYIRVAQSIFVEPAIERFGGPVFIVHGDADETVPYSYAVKAAEKYKNCKLVSIHGADHCFNGHLDELYTVIRSWKV
jgi:pimeloyl-ACP methyl ester carboxylesterase